MTKNTCSAFFITKHLCIQQYSISLRSFVLRHSPVKICHFIKAKKVHNGSQQDIKHPKRYYVITLKTSWYSKDVRCGRPIGGNLLRGLVTVDACIFVQYSPSHNPVPKFRVVSTLNQLFVQAISIDTN